MVVFSPVAQQTSSGIEDRLQAIQEILRRADQQTVEIAIYNTIRCIVFITWGIFFLQQGKLCYCYAPPGIDEETYGSKPRPKTEKASHKSENGVSCRHWSFRFSVHHQEALWWAI